MNARLDERRPIFLAGERILILILTLPDNLLTVDFGFHSSTTSKGHTSAYTTDLLKRGADPLSD
jgi:hypothetical protein